MFSSHNIVQFFCVVSIFFYSHRAPIYRALLGEYFLFLFRSRGLIGFLVWFFFDFSRQQQLEFWWYFFSEWFRSDLSIPRRLVGRDRFFKTKVEKVKRRTNEWTTNAEWPRHSALGCSGDSALKIGCCRGFSWIKIPSSRHLNEINIFPNSLIARFSDLHFKLSARFIGFFTSFPPSILMPFLIPRLRCCFCYSSLALLTSQWWVEGKGGLAMGEINRCLLFSKSHSPNVWFSFWVTFWVSKRRRRQKWTSTIPS